MNIKEFREKWAKRKQYDSWQDVLDTVRGNDVMLTTIIDEVSTKFALEVSTKALENADKAISKYYFIDHDDVAIDRNVFDDMINNRKNIPL